MFSNEKKWIVAETFHLIADSVSSFFIGLFIWQANYEISQVLKYFLSLFVFIPVAGLVGAYLADKINAKLSFFISIVFRLISLISVVFYGDYFISNLVLFGFLMSLAIGFYSVPRNACVQLINKSDSILKLTVYLSSVTSFAGIIVPFAGSFWVEKTGSYSGIFLVSFFLLIFSGFIFSLINFPVSDGTFQILEVVKKMTKEDHFKMVKIYFYNGIRNGISWSIFGIMTLVLVGNDLVEWGSINSVISLVAVIAGFIYSKKIRGESKYPSLVITAYIYCFLSIIFIVNYSIYSLILLLLVHSIASVFINSSVSALISELLQKDNNLASRANEYYSLLEIPLALGRVLPLLILWISGVGIGNELVFKLVFLIIAFVPIVSSQLLEKQK